MQSSRAGQGFTQPGLHSAMPAPRHAPHPGLLHSSPVTQASVPQDAAPEEPAQQLQPQLDIDPVVLVVKHFLESNGFKNSAKALEHEARKELEKVDDLDVSETNLVQILEEYAFLKQVEERRQKLIEENPLGADMMMLLDMHMGLPTPADGAGYQAQEATQRGGDQAPPRQHGSPAQQPPRSKGGPFEHPRRRAGTKAQR
eukprot:evm.model.scf_3390.3 EVM.evm.TU.scf_3390.3   scf_3390:9165-11819(+)